MAEYTARDFVTVVDEDGNESEVPKAWLGTGLLPAGTSKADGRRRAAVKDAPAALVAAQKAQADAESAVAALAKENEALKAELAKATVPAAPAPAPEQK